MMLIPVTDRKMIKFLAKLVADKLRSQSPDIVQCPHKAAVKILATDMGNGVQYEVEDVPGFVATVERFLKG